MTEPVTEVQRIKVQKAEPPAPVPASTFDKLLTLALEKNVGGAELEKIVALAERMADRNAAQEYAHAIAAFQAECPPLREDKVVTVKKDGVRQYDYTYAPLERILKVIRPLLLKHGLSISWDSEYIEPAPQEAEPPRQGEKYPKKPMGRVKVACKVLHYAGHCETATFSAAIDGQARMSEVQASASALTYGRRQSLIQALGLETDPDADGLTDPDARIGNVNGASAEPRISEDQYQDLVNACVELGRDPEKFGPYLKTLRIGTGRLQDLRTGDYQPAVAELQKWRAKALAEKAAREAAKGAVR